MSFNSIKATIIKILKKSSILSFIGYSYRTLKYRINSLFYSNKPVQADKVIFSRSGLGFADNLKAIAIWLHENNPDLKLVWAYSDDNSLASLPEYIVPVKFETKSYFEELATASTWVFSNLVPNGITKKKSQLYIQTWHGDRALKKILNDALIGNGNYSRGAKSRKIVENEICDYIVTGSDFAERMYRSSMSYNGEFLKSGCPRNDCLFNIEEAEAIKLKNDLNIPLNKKILLYAPTFRDKKLNEGKVDSDINLSIVLDYLQKKTGDEWLALTRAHGGKKLILEAAFDSRIMDVTTYPDIADLLIITDFLITDYSSCATDFAYIEKPILLYQDDYEEYTSENRGLYFSMEDSPFSVAKSMQEAIEFIDRFDTLNVKEINKAILDFYGSYEDGQATSRVCNCIINHIQRVESISG